MDSLVSSKSSSTAAASAEKIRHLPADARAAFQRFQDHNDLSAVDTVVFAVLEDFAPASLSAPVASLPPESRLIEDLGLDSLSITEIVFFTEDLFGISIANEEIVQVRTLDQLRAFVRRKVTERSRV